MHLEHLDDDLVSLGVHQIIQKPFVSSLPSKKMTKNVQFTAICTSPRLVLAGPPGTPSLQGAYGRANERNTETERASGIDNASGQGRDEDSLSLSARTGEAR
eukprot:GHVU01032877.1.p1 GENE.GHVU01032877.1~~GHVU01032877.1.p1  ORF type:complete len:102 (-),score=8.56 GHVU01032877.1:186-491(-)